MEHQLEHRRHPRYPVRYKSIFSSDGTQIEDGFVLDLALGGCRITSERLPPPGTRLELHIRPDHHAPVYVPWAVVKWTENVTFGVDFGELPELDASTLKRLLCLLPT
ncbi:MAG: PilZ domain-containing protein [Nitrospirae bacterium]|nr:PilZ domain-containing protein [Nitrospirota bacterium]